MLWPREAPPTIKAAVAGLWVMVALVVINLVTVLLIVPSGGIVVEDVVIGGLLVAIVVSIARARPWARFAAIGVAVLFLLGAVSQFQAGVPGIVQIAGVVQIVVMIGVVVALALRESGTWFGFAR